jgi:signal transduction histidine kinase
MRSIRRTLLLNVLLLLVVTLGVVSYFVYHTAEGALRQRQRTARELVQVRYADRQDEALRARAEELAGEVQSNWNRDEFRRQWIASEISALLSAPTANGSQVPVAIRAVTSSSGPVGFELNARLSTELRLNEEDLYRDSQGGNNEYLQVMSDHGTSWTSRSLSGHLLAPDEVPHKDSDSRASPFDDITLPDGTTARRVVLKYPVTRFSRVGSFWIPRPPRPDDGPPLSRPALGLGSAARGERRPPPNGGGPGFIPPPGAFNAGGYSLPNFYLHCAWSTSPDNPHLAPLLLERDQQLGEIDGETETAVRSLQSTLIWSVAAAIAVTLLGGWILVGIGLFPLKRLSFAVSEITTKDLHLDLDPKTLPAEVFPVAERLSQTLEDLQAAFAREKRAAADISHELRTPLAALTTTIEVSCRKVRTAEQYRQTLDDCRAIARQMSMLVERMLTLAWIDAGADRMNVEKVDLHDLLGGVAAIGRPLAEAHDLKFRVDCPETLVVTTDADKLREVVMNLIHNAIEYNRPEGSIDVRAFANDWHVVVEVADTGIGIAEDMRGKIFERFFRADPSRQATGVHAGLGLAIVKEYVERLGGRLKVDSTPGHGSRFRVELPAEH